MKLVFSFLVCLLFISCNTSTHEEIEVDPKGLIYITKTNVGFNIYSNKKELILEYTKQNCDSIILKELDDIWYTAKEFYNQESPKEQETKSHSITFLGTHHK